MRMNMNECVHSFYAADSGEPPALRTLLFLDFDPVLPGWPPDDAEVEREREPHCKLDHGVFDTSKHGVGQAFNRTLATARISHAAPRVPDAPG